jgi:hypothetical protein
MTGLCPVVNGRSGEELPGLKPLDVVRLRISRKIDKDTVSMHRRSLGIADDRLEKER